MTTTSVSQPKRTLFAGFPGEEKFDDKSDGLTDAGTFVKLIEFTVPDGKKRYLHQIFLTCRFSGKMEVRQGSSTIGDGETAPGQPTILFSWFPGRPIPAGDVVSVWFRQRDDAPTGQPVSAYLQSTETNA